MNSSDNNDEQLLMIEFEKVWDTQLSDELARLEENKDFNYEEVQEFCVGPHDTPIWLTSSGRQNHDLKDRIGFGVSGSVFASKITPQLSPLTQERETKLTSKISESKSRYSESKRHNNKNNKAYVDNETVAVKVQFSCDAFERESELMKLMSDHKIGPKFLSSWSAEGVGFIATERWDCSLYDYFANFARKFKRRAIIHPKVIACLEQKIHTLNDLGYVHGDILDKNILVKHIDFKITNICLTDFGLTDKAETWRKNPAFMKKMLDYHSDVVNKTHFYFKDMGITLDMLLDQPLHMDKALLYYYYHYHKKQ